MDEFILCHLLSFVLFVQNYNINGKEVFFLMGLTYINKKAWQTPLPSFLDLKNYLLLIHKRQALIEPDIHLVG
uniref:hypothetical protein n=1 Tax=Segatella copri TaxID=165179 RepID=UPI003FF0518B